MKIPRAIVKYTDEIEQAVKHPGEWVLYKRMSGTSALQTSRKYNQAEVQGGVDNLEFGVGDDGNLYVQFRG